MNFRNQKLWLVFMELNIVCMARAMRGKSRRENFELVELENIN